MILHVRNIIWLILLLLVPVTAQAFSDEYNGRVVISKNFDHTKKTVGISFEWELNYDLVLFQQIITQELMANGYSVIERLQIKQILDELSLDQTGAVKGVTSTVKDAVSKTSRDEVKTEYSKSDLKKLGEMLGISHMLYFGLREKAAVKDAMYIRLINLETAEIVVSVFLSLNKYSDLLTRPVARSVVKAITESYKLKSPTKDILINFYKSREEYTANLMKIAPDKILYQEDLNDNYIIVSGT